MLPLAKFWTWLGNYFLPIAIAWAYFVRNGADEGIKVSRGYWGLVASLTVGALLMLTLALYIGKARKAKKALLPPNTAFETDEVRNLTISWGTIAIYFTAILTALVVFGSRYADSKIYAWDDKKAPLAGSFWESRVIAWTQSCTKSPCYAMGNRFGEGDKKLEYVDQYIPYVTDLVLVVLASLFIASLVTLLIVVFRREPVQLWPND
ncbi:hypothetical protein [Bradyrhizobium sp. SZCCHNR1039]|uniref:hypothetical protein n=1 Tax=Bradyrhizobium sp. SZCCHNR1039 TaxID=3057350 RepID=UPI0029165A5E|nr:hypothetical protein [Bradyrhizobium sp. SZCCHNR1039]